MRTGRPTTPLTLTMTERETLQQWVRRPKTAQALAQRAQIILTCAEGPTKSWPAWPDFVSELQRQDTRAAGHN